MTTYKGFKFFGQVKHYFFFSQVVRKQENPVAFVASYSRDYILISFIPRRKINFRIRKRIVQKKIVDINRNSLTLWVPFPFGEEELVFEELVGEAEVPGRAEALLEEGPADCSFSAPCGWIGRDCACSSGSVRALF